MTMIERFVKERNEALFSLDIGQELLTLTVNVFRSMPEPLRSCMKRYKRLSGLLRKHLLEKTIRQSTSTAKNGC